MNMILIDGHAHLYPGYDAGAGLDAAAAAFQRTRLCMPAAPDGPDCLILADHSEAEGFSSLSRFGARGWQVRRLDWLTLSATRDRDRASVLVFAGRQVRAANGLEVLALLMGESVRDGGTLLDRAESVLAAGGIPAVPWGFGKWWGKRGREVRELLRSTLGQRIALVDSSTRPPGPIWSGRREFDLAEQLGIPIIAGTDPLPLSGEEERLGRFGCVLHGQVDLDEPALSLGRILNSMSVSPPTFGTRETLVRGLRIQLTLQLRR